MAELAVHDCQAPRCAVYRIQNPAPRSAWKTRRIFELLLAATLTLSVSAWAQSVAPPFSPSPTPAELAGPPADATHLNTGLASKVLVPGDGSYTPDDNDNVAVYFTAWTPAGAKFMDNSDRGTPARFDLQTVFPGFRQGVVQMVLNEKRRLWIPSHLAPKQPSSGPQGAVVMDVTLAGILRIPNPPSDLATPPEDAQRTPGGARSVVLKPGRGELRVAPDGAAVANYTGWGDDGRVFDSTATRGRPTLFMMEHTMMAFAEVLRVMAVGETRRVWIAGAAVGGQWPEAPDGDLVFDVELVEIREVAEDATGIEGLRQQ